MDLKILMCQRNCKVSQIITKGTIKVSPRVSFMPIKWSPCKGQLSMHDINRWWMFQFDRCNYKCETCPKKYGLFMVLHPQSDIRHQQCFLHLSLPFAKWWAHPRCTLILGVALWWFSYMWYGVWLTFVSLVVSSAKHCLESFHKVFSGHDPAL